MTRDEPQENWTTGKAFLLGLARATQRARHGAAVVFPDEMRCRSFYWMLLVVLGLAQIVAVRGEIQLVGYVGGETRTTFALTNSLNGRSGWVPIGGQFEGYTLVEFLEAKEMLVLKKGEEALQVKLRPASFSIPAEVEGRAREEQFFVRMREMAKSLGPGNKVYFPEDYIATATQFGRVVVSHETKDGVETIVMELPAALRPPPDAEGREHRANFSVSMPRRDKTRVKLTIR